MFRQSINKNERCTGDFPLSFAQIRSDTWETRLKGKRRLRIENQLGFQGSQSREAGKFFRLAI